MQNKQILISPIITEKTLGKVTDGVYVFQVAPKANKVQVAEQIEDLYKVKVATVNIINSRGEEKMAKGKFRIKAKKTKKAIITLKKGQKIPGFEDK